MSDIFTSQPDVYTPTSTGTADIFGNPSRPSTPSTGPDIFGHGGGGDGTSAGSSLYAELRAAYPWLDQVGLDPGFFQDLAASAASSDEVIVKLRQNPIYKARFPGLWRNDGSIRMNEAQYLQTEQSYKQLVNQFGYGSTYKNPADYKGLFDSEQDPNELQKRLQTYADIKDSGQGMKDAFYVYAGLKLTDDDLYQATVDPTHHQALTGAYNQAVASSTFDYSTWLTRATEVGMNRVADSLGVAGASGALGTAGVQAVLRTDPNFARTVMDAIYSGSHGGVSAPATTGFTGDGPGSDLFNYGQASGGGLLDLESLLNAFQEAAIGSAATGAGLAMPTKERIAELRTAGVDRARALSAYGQFGASGGVYGAASQRAGLGQFGQKQFEDAAFLGNAGSQAQLQAALAQEQAAGSRTGSFGVSQGSGSRTRQTGLKSY